MTYQPSEAEALATTLTEHVEATLGKEFAGRLSDAHCTTLTEHEDRAVVLHGKQILAAIEGRGFAGTAGASTYMDDSILVPLIDRVEADSAHLPAEAEAATIAKTSRTKNTQREPTVAELLADLARVAKRLGELMSDDIVTKKLTDEEGAELQEMRQKAEVNLARIDRLLGLPTA